MAFVFKMIDEHKCDGCARKIKNCVKKLKGVESAEVKKTKDKYGNDEFTIIVKGSFNPEKIILGVEISKNKRIELVSGIGNGEVNQVKPIEVKHPFDSITSSILQEGKGSSNYNGTNDEPLKNLKNLASNNLGKAEKLTELANQCETLKGQLHDAWARRNELATRKQYILNRGFPNATLPRRSRGREPKKEDESEVLYGKLASKEIKVEDFVHKYKRLKIKKHRKINPLDVEMFS